MVVTSKLSSDSNTVDLLIDGSFNLSVQREFREAYRQYLEPGQHFQVDMSKLEYIDSSALGMLLLLKEHADKLKGKVTISNSSQEVKKLLLMVKFNQKIHHSPGWHSSPNIKLVLA